LATTRCTLWTWWIGATRGTWCPLGPSPGPGAWQRVGPHP
jgi:hypothetical protein